MKEALTLHKAQSLQGEKSRAGEDLGLTVHCRRNRNLCAPLFDLFSPTLLTDLLLGKGCSGGPCVAGTHCLLSVESSVRISQEHRVRCSAFRFGKTYDKSSRAVSELVSPPLACLNYYALAFWPLNYS